MRTDMVELEREVAYTRRELKVMAALLDDDVFASTFRSIDEYRAALRRFLVVVP